MGHKRFHGLDRSLAGVTTTSDGTEHRIKASNVYDLPQCAVFLTDATAFRPR
ncbi:MAG: hypothetical protein IPL77_06455 [Flavobacteriales bacterium]|nr:hypothetical protein [Flavobacteriales bacterium]